MSFQPTGTLYLIANVPLDNTYTDTIDFDNNTEQLNYFMQKVQTTFEQYNYIRKDTSIRIAANIEEIKNINYAVYCNSAGKWIYVFVLDKKYVSEGATELLIETDVFQTYMFNYSWGQTYIDREHCDRWAGVNSPIYNVINENLNLGDEYIKENEHLIAESEEYYLIVSSEKLEGEDTYPAPNMVQHYPTPLFYYVMPSDEKACILLADNPAVVSISLIPFLTFDYNSLTPITYTNPKYAGGTVTLKRITANMPTRRTFPGVPKFENMNLPQSFAVGTPRHYKYESKLLVYPYTYHTLTDYQGRPLILKNEYLNGNDVVVELSQNISHDIKSKYYISSGYKGETNGKENALINNTVNDLPLVTDVYKNYIMQHKASALTGISLAGVEGAGAVAMGALMTGATGGIMAAVGGATALMQIAGEMAKRKDLQAVPDTVRSLGNNISFDLQDGNCSLKLIRHAVHESIKKVLGDYFAMFGYKSMEVKIPNLRSRYYYNYIRTIGCNIDGDFDIKDLVKLRGIYDNGVRIWHNRSQVIPLSYARDNVEMSLI